MIEKIENLLKQLTLEEKAGLCSGGDFWHTKAVERLGIPQVLMTDGPHGLRKEKEDDDNIALKASYKATCFPTASCSASSWNKENLYKMGKAIAEQAKDQRIGTVLGPGINIKRSSLCGRNFEYFSEDPILSAELAIAYINGAQENGVGTSLKHYAANNQEYLRMTIDSVLDERTLHETYLRAFEYTVKRSQPTTVMASYNRINGTYSCDNKELLTDILRTKWGWDGLVLSDWGATNNRVEGIKAGMDLEMPYFGRFNDLSIVKAVKKGTLSMQDLDNCVRRILKFVFECANVCSPQEEFFADYEQAHQLAREIAADSLVLLKNEENLFPFNKKEKVTVIGQLAEQFRYQGSGSSRINPYKLVNFIDTLKNEGVEYEYAKGYDMTDSGYNKELIDEAVRLASKSDKILLFMGLIDSFESEGYDRTTINMPDGHTALLEELYKVNPNIAVVLMGGSVVEFSWLMKAKSVLNCYLSGEAGNEAIFDVIFGDKTPSGKLAETYPIAISDNLADKYFRAGPKTIEYRESVFIGYKYYDTAEKKVQFPFGYGLSYTTFEYSNLKLSSDNIKDSDTLTVTFDITNSGKVYGGEIAQLYVKDKESTIFRPEKELQGFEKVYLEPNETKTVTIILDKKAFSYYNVNIHDWHVESGEFEILIGASSRDIKLSQTVYVQSSNNDAIVPDYRETCPSYYNIKNVNEIPTEEFAYLYGRELPSNVKAKRGQYNITSPIMEIQHTVIGRFLVWVAPKLMLSQVKNVDQTTLLAMQHSLEEIPLRALCGMSAGIVSLELADGIAMLANRKIFRGLGKCAVGLINTLRTLADTKKKNKEKAKKEKELNSIREKQLSEKKLAKKTEKLNEKLASKAEKQASKAAEKAEKVSTKEDNSSTNGKI